MLASLASLLMRASTAVRGTPRVISFGLVAATLSLAISFGLVARRWYRWPRLRREPLP